MDKAMQVMRLAQGLRQAGRHGDWRALQRLDASVADVLAAWAPGAVRSELERQSLKALVEAHAEARQLCDAALQTVSQTLSQMREGRERWRAYAVYGEPALEGQP